MWSRFIELLAISGLEPARSIERLLAARQFASPEIADRTRGGNARPWAYCAILDRAPLRRLRPFLQKGDRHLELGHENGACLPLCAQSCPQTLHFNTFSIQIKISDSDIGVKRNFLVCIGLFGTFVVQNTWRDPPLTTCIPKWPSIHAGRSPSPWRQSIR